jgi:hypothetical protein
MKIFILALILITISLLTGCGPASYQDESGTLSSLPPVLANCTPYRINGNNGAASMHVLYCPGQQVVATSYPEGKTTAYAEVITPGQTQTYPLGTKSVDVAPSTMTVPLEDAPLNAFFKLGYKFSKVTCNGKECDVTLTKDNP